MVFDSGLWLGC
jgi:C1A family cysteine protease